MESRHHNLKTRQRRERHGYPDSLSLRVHRALSWLDRAEQEADPDKAPLKLADARVAEYFARQSSQTLPPDQTLWGSADRKGKPQVIE